jgi:hypothetical protein
MSDLAVYALASDGVVPLHSVAPIGDIAFSTVFGTAGGCGLDSLSFSMTLPRGFSSPYLVQGALLELRCGPVRLGRATLTTIDFETGEATAAGVFKRAADFIAFDSGTFAGVLNPKVGVQNAIASGLEWQVDSTTLTALDVTLAVTGTAANLDATTWYTVGDLLDAYCGQQGSNVFWGIDAGGALRIYATPTTPDYLLSPTVPAMDSTTTDYETDLLCRYYDITKPVGDGATFYQSAILASSPARVGTPRKFATEDITSHGPLTADQAQDIANQTLAAKTPTLTYNGGVTLSTGDVRTIAGSMPVAPWRVVAESGSGLCLRHHGWRNMQGALMPGFAQEWVVGKASYDATGSVTLNPTADASKSLGQVLSSTATQVAEVGKKVVDNDQKATIATGVVQAAVQAAQSDISETNTFAQQLSATLTQAQSDIDAAVTQADADRAASANGSASNYAANGSFEYVNADGSLVGWTVEGAGFSVDTTQHHSGSQCITTTGSGRMCDGAVPVMQGQTWEIGIWRRSPDTTARNVGALIQTSSDGGSTWADTALISNSVATAAAWEYKTVQYLVAAGVTHIRSAVNASYTGGASVWLDDVSLTNVTALVAAQAAAQAAADAASEVAGSKGRVFYGATPPTTADGAMFNLVKNADFEDGTTGWAAFANSSMSNDTSEKHSGTRSLKVVTTVAGGGVANSVVNGFEGVVSSGVLGDETMSVWVKGSAGSTFRYRTHEYVNPGVIEQTPAPAFNTTAATGDWQQLTFVAPKNTAGSFNRIEVTLTTAGTFWLDDACLTHTPVPVPFFIGGLDLWIDQTPASDGTPQNTPKRWNGSAWVAVTDKAALDAATAAAAAQSTADGAITAANGINRLFWGTAAPTSSTPGLPGDTWWVRADDSSPITGQYLCTAGTRTGSGNTWTAAPLSHETIASVDAGTISVGTLDADRIGAETITGDKIAAETIEAEHMVATLDFTAKEVDAGTFVGGFWRTGTTGRRMEVGHNAVGSIDPSNIAFYNGISGETPGVVGPWNAGGGTSGAPALAISSPMQSDYPHTAEIDLFAGTTATTTKKLGNAAGWASEPAVEISLGNLKVGGDIHVLAGRVIQGDDTNGVVVMQMSSVVGGYGAPYGWPTLNRTGNTVILSGMVKTNTTVAAGSWLVTGPSGLPAPADACQKLFPVYVQGAVSGVYLALVSGIWCITTPFQLASGAYVALDGITYPCAP